MKYLVFLCLISALMVACSQRTSTARMGTAESAVTIRGERLDAPAGVVANKNVRFENGVVYLKSIGIGKKIEDATEWAKINGMEAVLFKGLPGSSVQDPLVNEPTKEKHQKFFVDFLSPGGEYARYIVQSNYDPEQRIKLKKGLQVGLDLEINYAELRKRLEDEQILKVFGIR